MDMRELPVDKLDAILTLAAARCVQDEAEAFLSADISGIPDNPELEKKILNGTLGSNNSHSRGKKRGIKWAIKIGALVALLCMSIAFTACMFVPVIREVVWNTIVEWYEDHIEVSFSDTEMETEAPTEPPEDEIPTSIEQTARLTYLPEGYVVGSENLSKSQYYVDYYVPSGEWKLAFYQGIIDGSNSFMDNESSNIVYLKVNDYGAVLTEYEGEQTVYSLVWQDTQYRYTLYGYFDSVTEMIKIAEGIKIQ
jgi:hypothetical protein